MADGVRLLNITKSFKKGKVRLPVLEAVSFSVKKGALLLLTGKNGSGKTTLLKIMAGLLLPDKGEVFLNDQNPEAAKNEIGYLGSEERALYFTLTGRQNLEFFAALYGVKAGEIKARTEKLTERLKMEPYIDLPVEDCSLGMRQRLVVAKALIHHPDICLFDEPLKGLDKEARKIFTELLRFLMKNKKTIIIATHNETDFKGLKFTVRELGR